MRISVLAAAACCAVLAALPAVCRADQILSRHVRIYGGLGNSPTKAQKLQYRGKGMVEFQTTHAPGTIIVST